MFHIINSMGLFEYITVMVVTILISIVGIIILKESQKTWKWACYITIINCCFIIAKRVVSEYMPNTTLNGIFQILMLGDVVVYPISIMIVGLFANKNQKK